MMMIARAGKVPNVITSAIQPGIGRRRKPEERAAGRRRGGRGYELWATCASRVDDLVISWG
jgi:hypothetical protein